MFRQARPLQLGRHIGVMMQQRQSKHKQKQQQPPQAGDEAAR
jgi:hypothetical protein